MDPLLIAALLNLATALAWALAAMLAAYLLFLIVAEVDDAVRGRPTPPPLNLWRRPLCWLTGHEDDEESDEHSPPTKTCLRCGQVRDGGRP